MSRRAPEGVGVHTVGSTAVVAGWTCVLYYYHQPHLSGHNCCCCPGHALLGGQNLALDLETLAYHVLDLHRGLGHGRRAAQVLGLPPPPPHPLTGSTVANSSRSACCLPLLHLSASDHLFLLATTVFPTLASPAVLPLA